MTKETLVEIIYLNINSAKPSADLNIKRVDIKSLLPLLINDAVTAFSRQSRKDVYEELRIYGASNGETVNSQFLTTFKVTPAIDVDTGYYYIDVPKKVAVLPFSRGINDLRPLKGMSYQRITSFLEISGIESFITAYWHENFNGTSKILINNIGTPVCEHFLQIVVDFSAMSDTDELYLPGGFNEYILSSARQYLLGERQIPAEYKIDNKEDR